MATQTAAPTQKSLKDHFRQLTPGKLMGLKQITDVNGKFKVFALDQSQSFKKALRALHEKLGPRKNPRSKKFATPRWKSRAPSAPGDRRFWMSTMDCAVHQFGRPRARRRSHRPRRSIERRRDPGEYEPGWSVEQIKRMGCSRSELLVYMDVEDAAYTQKQLKFAKEIFDACAEHDILLMTEETFFPAPG